MDPLAASSLRSNLGTWVVPARLAPRVAVRMLEQLPREKYDPDFCGQELKTIYFDTLGLDLFKARRQRPRYLTLRLRCYDEQVYALSAKTESEKWRQEITPADVQVIQAGGSLWPEAFLPAHLLARLLELTGEAPLLPVTTVCCRRYAVENLQDRLTLDLEIRTSRGESLPYGVLEFKSAQADSPPPSWGLEPMKLSKFLWAMEV
jgi:hypothetical protein